MRRPRLLLRIFAALLGCLVPAAADAQSTTAFTYQGLLTSSGLNTSGGVDLQFRLYDSLSGPSQVGPQVNAAGVVVNKGVFTVSLDFGAVFNTGHQRWLEIDVRQSTTPPGAFTTLSPRQPLSPAPLAMGIAGVPISLAGPKTVDQNQLDGYISVGGGAETAPWQSFTAGLTGQLSQVDLRAAFTGPPQGHSTLMVTVHPGVGVSGAAMGSATMNVAGAGQTVTVSFTYSGIQVFAGQQYTLEITPGSQVYVSRSNGSISGASGFDGSNAASFLFKTYVTPITAITATCANVPWSGVVNVPANVTGAFSPWTTDTGGIAYTGGTVGIGTSTPEGGLSVTSFKSTLSPQQPGVHMGRECCGYPASTGVEIVADTNGAATLDFNTLPTTTDYGARLLYDKVTGVLYVYGAKLCATTFCPSTIRLKDNVEPMTGALELVEKLRAVRFDWKPEEAPNHNTTHDFGFIAEDVENVFPEVVVKSTDGHVLGMDYARLTSVAVEAIKQLKSENEAKQRELDKLKADNADMQTRLGRIEAALTQLRPVEAHEAGR